MCAAISQRLLWTSPDHHKLEKLVYPWECDIYIFISIITAWKPFSKFISGKDKHMRRLHYLDTCPKHYNKHQSHLHSIISLLIPNMVELRLCDKHELGKMVIYTLSSVFQKQCLSWVILLFSLISWLLFPLKIILQITSLAGNYVSCC